MRQIKIDFLVPAEAHGHSVNWLSVGLWLSGIVFAFWQFGFTRQLLEEREILAGQMKVAPVTNSQKGSPIRSADIESLNEKSWFGPRLLAGVEQAVGRIRSNDPELLLERLNIDANVRRLTIRGNAAQPKTAELLAAELQTEFPHARVSVPNVRNTNDGAQFEVNLNFPSTRVQQ